MLFMSYRFYIIGLYSNYIFESSYCLCFLIFCVVYSYIFIDGEKILFFLWYFICWVLYIVFYFFVGFLVLIFLVFLE